MPRRLALLIVTVLALIAAGCGDDDGAGVRELDGGADSVSGSPTGPGSATGSGSASAPAPGSASAPTEAAAGDGGYEYASDVGVHRLVVVSICPMGDLLDEGEFGAVATIYREGVGAPEGGAAPPSPGDFASEPDRAHGLDDYYDTPAPLADFVIAALEGTGPFEGETDAVRAQGVEKGIQNQVMVAWVIDQLRTAVADAEAGDFDPAEGAVHHWDQAWALYHGAAPSCGPHATADKRAADFGTVGADGTTARANEAILDAMIAGRDALLVEDAARAAAAADEVLRNVVITYSQAAVRYATLVEEDLVAGDPEQARVHQAEGLAFWRVIEAYVAPLGADVDAIGAIFDLASNPGANGGGDQIRAAMAPAWEALAITADDIGELS